MVVATVIQKEINKREERIIIINRPYQPNVREKALTGKFYARHDFPDETLIDPEVEQAIFKAEVLPPKDRFKEPLTTNMEYGWYTEKKVPRTRYTFHYPRTSSMVTRIGCLIAQEEQKMPKKPFTGKPFNLMF